MYVSIKKAAIATLSVATMAFLGVFIANPSSASIQLYSPLYASIPCAASDMKESRNFVVYGKLTNSSNQAQSGVKISVKSGSAGGKEIAKGTTGRDGTYKVPVKAKGLKAGKIANFAVVAAASGKSANKVVAIRCDKAVKVSGKYSVSQLLVWLPISTY